MDLEMRDYERTVSDLTNQLAERDNSISEIELDLKSEKHKTNSLEEQLHYCTTQADAERERADKLKVIIFLFLVFFSSKVKKLKFVVHRF